MKRKKTVNRQPVGKPRPANAIGQAETDAIFAQLGGYRQIADLLGLPLTTTNHWAKHGMPKAWAYFLVTFFCDYLPMPDVDFPAGVVSHRDVLMGVRPDEDSGQGAGS